jgi:hypothetical protein
MVALGDFDEAHFEVVMDGKVGLEINGKLGGGQGDVHAFAAGQLELEAAAVGGTLVQCPTGLIS